MLWLLAFLLGLVVGLIVTRDLRPLLLERVRALPLAVLLLVACLLPVIFSLLAPSALWTQDRALLISLQALSYLLALLFIGVNLLPGKLNLPGRPPIRWYHRGALAMLAVGLLADALVVLLNHGYMPIPVGYLADISDSATVTAINNQALLLKQLIGPSTVLPWLGQIWRLDFLASLRISAFPYFSPGEAVAAVGFFLTGLSQFFGHRDITAA